MNLFSAFFKPAVEHGMKVPIEDSFKEKLSVGKDRDGLVAELDKPLGKEVGQVPFTEKEISPQIRELDKPLGKEVPSAEDVGDGLGQQNNELDGPSTSEVFQGYKEVRSDELPEKQGGSYKELFKEGEGDKYEIHHMPADSASPLERGDGPAIRMEKDDHRKTASCGNSKEAREYRAEQRELIAEGKFREALQMDIDDIREKFGSKYDKAIGEMETYVHKLEQEGIIHG